MLDLHRLRLLRELSHRGTLAAVASALSYSPSAVSQQLAKLESEVGVPLLQHVGRRVRLTTHAEVLVTHTEAVLRRLERAEADLAASADELVGTVRVAAFQSVAFAFIPSVLTQLASRHPRLTVDFEVCEPEEAIAGLLAHDLDLVVDEEFPGWPITVDDRLDRELLLDDPLQLVAPPSWAVHDLADLKDRPWTLEPSGTRGRVWAETFCREHGFEPQVPFGFNDLAMRCRMVETGHAAALLTSLAPLEGAGKVTFSALPGDPTRRICTVVRHGMATHPVSIALRLVFGEAVGTAGHSLPAGEV